MKTKNFIQQLDGNRRILIGVFALLFSMAGMRAFAEPGENVSANMCLDEKVILAINNVSSNALLDVDFGTLFRESSDHREQDIQELLNIFNNPKTGDYPKCCAAYYLGEMRASEAVDSLANQITLEPIVISHEPAYGYNPPVDALVKIGTPSIPAVIRNLAESEDEKVREFSMAVLYLIDAGDKDIVQLRLQKALDAQTDAAKKARLQSALKSVVQFQIGKVDWR